MDEVLNVAHGSHLKIPEVDNDCLFCRIVAGEIPATIVHETDTTLAFRDIDPKAPVHVLVIPKAHHADVAALARDDPAAAADLLAAAAAVAEAEGCSRDGFRLIFNTGGYAGQEVFHVHAHVARRRTARARCWRRDDRAPPPGSSAPPAGARPTRRMPALSVALHRADREPVAVHRRRLRQPGAPAGRRTAGSGSARSPRPSPRCWSCRPATTACSTSTSRSPRTSTCPRTATPPSAGCSRTPPASSANRTATCGTP